MTSARERDHRGRLLKVHDQHAAFDFQKLREAVDYDPNTGWFTWKSTSALRVRPGQRAGTVDGIGYRSISVFGKRFKEHRLAFAWMNGKFPEYLVDHIDGNKSNNAWVNLREATNSQNCSNRDKVRTNRVGLKGVSKSKKNGKYVAQICYSGNNKLLGYFDTPEEAHQTYVAAARKFHGEFANPGSARTPDVAPGSAKTVRVTSHAYPAIEALADARSGRAA